mgnify:CR=1 FL=1
METLSIEYRIPSPADILLLTKALSAQRFEMGSHDGRNLEGLSIEAQSEYLRTAPVPITFEGEFAGRVHHYATDTPYVSVVMDNQVGKRLSRFLENFEFPRRE